VINASQIGFRNLSKWITSKGAAIFAFALPLHFLASSYALVIWLLFTLFYLMFGGCSWKNFVFNARHSKSIFLIIFLYLLLISGLLISDNIAVGLNKIEVSIPFFVIPILFLINKGSINVSLIFNAFIGGLLLSIILSFINLSIKGTITLDGFYADFNLFHHSSYYSMLMNIAIAVFLFTLEKINFSNFYSFIFVVVFSVLIFLISSKAGVTILIFLFFIKFIQVVKSSSSLYPKFFFLSFLIFFSILLGINKRVQNMVVNFENIVKQDTPLYPTESTAIRWKIWEKSVKLISQSIVFGYGTGDANSELLKAYNEEPYLLRHIIKKRYNAHNTFFQLWIMLGIMGPLIIFSLLFFTLRSHHYSYFSVGVVVIFLINFFLESMLERQAGVMTFTFFICLLIACRDSPFFQRKLAY